MWCRSKPTLDGEQGFSLVEVILVVLIMGILTSVAAQKWSGALEQSRFEATREEMDRLAEAIVGNANLATNGMRTDFGYVGDVGALPPDLDALVVNPGLDSWNGPYVQHEFKENPNDFKEDAWGIRYTYTGGVSLTSHGSGTEITRQIAGAVSDLTSNSVVGSVTDGLDNSPGPFASSVLITIRYPDGHGGVAVSTVSPGPGGAYAFPRTIPVGNHAIMAVYQMDTVTRYISILPKSESFVNFRFPGNLWNTRSASGADAELRGECGGVGESPSGALQAFDILNAARVNGLALPAPFVKSRPCRDKALVCDPSPPAARARRA